MPPSESSTRSTSSVTKRVAEALGLGAELVHHLRPHDPLGVAGVVLDVGRVLELAAPLEALEDERLEVGAGGVERGRVAGRPAADDDHVFDLLLAHLVSLQFVLRLFFSLRHTDVTSLSEVMGGPRGWRAARASSRLGAGRPSCSQRCDGAPELEEGHDPGRDRQPEGDRRGRSGRRRRPRASGRPKSTKAPIIPASTAPTPPGAKGIRLATMPMKKPWTTTAERDADPEGLEARPRGSRCCAAQKPIAPATASPPRRGMADQVEGGPDAVGERSPGPSPAGGPAPARRWPWAKRAIRRSKSAGISAIEHRRGRSPPPAIAAGTIVTSTAGLARQHAGAQQDAEDDQRQRVDRCTGGPRKATIRVADLAPRHPRLAQRPVGEHDASGAAGREEAASRPGPPC